MIANFYYAETIGKEISDSLKEFNENNITILYTVIDKDNGKTLSIGGGTAEDAIKTMMFLLLGMYRNTKELTFPIFCKKVFKAIMGEYRKVKIKDA